MTVLAQSIIKYRPRGVPEYVISGIASAEKFVLAPEVAALLPLFQHQISKDIESNFQFASLPFDSLWIEYKKQNCDEILGVYYVGTGTSWTASSYMLTEEATKFRIYPGLTRFWIAEGNYHLETDAYKDFKTDFKKIPTSEEATRFNAVCVLLLCFINCKNLLEEVPCKISRSRQAALKRTGRRPIFTYKTLRLKLTERQKASSFPTGISRADVRAHIVRGHFKKRKNGVYWWSPFFRGDPSLGVVVKNYEVKI